jgi:hypothetical protein
MSEEELKGWFSNLIHDITKPITVGGHSTGVSALGIATTLLGKRSDGILIILLLNSYFSF